MTETSAMAQLAEIERDRLSVYVARSNTPWWYLPYLGIATGLMLASNDLQHPAMTVAVVVLYGAAIGGLVRWANGKAGILPRLRGTPGPLLRPLLVFAAVAGVVVVGGTMTTLLLEVPWSFVHVGTVAGVVIWLGGWLAIRIHDRRANRMAAAARIER